MTGPTRASSGPSPPCGRRCRPASVAAFDAGLQAITQAPVVDLGTLDDFLSGWWRIATRAAADPAGWQRMHQEADQLQSGVRPAGRTLAEAPGRRGTRL